MISDILHGNQEDLINWARTRSAWDLPSKKMLLRKAWHALTPNGVLIVYDPLIDDGRMQPHGLLSSLNMLIETAGGFEYTSAECMKWMHEAGFLTTRVEPLGDLHTAVIGTKHPA